MNLTQVFTLKTQSPLRGGEAGIWLSQYAQEVIDAQATGSGPGQPDSTGTPTPGNILPGQIVQLNSQGNLALATPTDLASAFPSMYFLVHSGDVDFSGSFVGKLNVVHGGVRFITLSFDTGSYTPGAPLVISSGTAGNLALKGAVGDHNQVVAVVGPLGIDPSTGALDVFMTQGCIQGS